MIVNAREEIAGVGEREGGELYEDNAQYGILLAKDSSMKAHERE